jgi:hypothetical protein
MVTDSFFSLACAGLIAFVFGLIFCYSGYRFFLVLLPIWGFVFGFVLGAQTMVAIFGDPALLGTVTSWVVGFFVGAVFAVLSYLFYFAAVALIAAALGYAVAVGLLEAIGLPMGFIVWIVGIVAAVALAIIVLRFNIQKYVVIIATAVLGAGMIIGTFVLLFNPAAAALDKPVQTAIKTSPFLAIIFLVVAVLGIWLQVQTTRNWEINEYNRLSGVEPEYSPVDAA